MPVNKRPVRSEKKIRRLTLALLVCACALALFVLFFINRKESQIADLPRNEVTAVTYQTRAAEEIAKITVENAAGTYTVTQQDGACTLEGRNDFVFSENLLGEVLRNAAVIITEETLTTVSEDEWKNYGLALGSIRVQVTYTDGVSLAFRIGDLVPQETPAYYFRMEGDSRLGVVSQDVQEIYALSVNALHRVTDPALQGDLIDRIAFTGENAFTAERRADGWYLTAPFEYPLAAAQMNTLLKNLEGLRFSQHVARAEESDLSVYGLHPARRTLTLDIAASIVTGYDENDQQIAAQALDEYQVTIACGDDIGEILFYCLYRGDVVKATRFSSGLLLTQSYEKLLLTRPFNIPTNLLTRLEWEQNGVVRAWDITLHERVLENGAFETDESGNTLYDVRVQWQGAEADADQFLKAYARLTDVKTTDALPAGYTVSGQAEVKIRLYYNGEVREAAFYPYDALHWAVTINDEARFYVSRGALDNVGMPE